MIQFSNPTLECRFTTGFADPRILASKLKEFEDTYHGFGLGRPFYMGQAGKKNICVKSFFFLAAASIKQAKLKPLVATRSPALPEPCTDGFIVPP